MDLSSSASIEAWIGLGANLGDALETIQAAMRALNRMAQTRVTARSRLWSSTPIEASGPDYVNAVVRVQTTLQPMALLQALHALEQANGRQRPYRNAPRTLDLDLLLYGRPPATVHSVDPTLTLPHPRMHQRAFVLKPLAEIDPDLRIPVCGVADGDGDGQALPLTHWLAACADQKLYPCRQQ